MRRCVTALEVRHAQSESVLAMILLLWKHQTPKGPAHWVDRKRNRLADVEVRHFLGRRETMIAEQADAGIELQLKLTMRLKTGR